MCGHVHEGKLRVYGNANGSARLSQFRYSIRSGHYYAIYSILPHELDIVQISFSCLLSPPPFLERKKMMRNGIKVIQ